MNRLVVLLSGPVASGKSRLALALVERHGMALVKTRRLLEEAVPGAAGDRARLQRAGDRLDRATGGRWVLDALSRVLRETPEDQPVVVDCVRTEAQIDAVRQGYGRSVVHIHVRAPLEVLGQRYEQRRGRIKELPTYGDLRRNRTEKRIDELARFADIVIDTDRTTEADVLIRVAGHLGLFGRSYDRLVDVLIGGEYGSEGKGHVASYLAPEYEYLVRVGGPNAGHTVYEEPEPYTFHHLPSGTRNSEAKLVIGPGAVLNVAKLLEEMNECGVGTERLYIDPHAIAITQDDIELEMKLLRGSIGSTGQGVGAATARRVMRGALGDVTLARDIHELGPFIRPTLDVLEQAFAAGMRVFLEGTQGTGLSLYHGPYPYVTSRDTTVSGCLADAGIAPSRVRKVIMVCRTHPIRVAGNSGPMSREISWADVSRRSGIPLEELEASEITSTTHRRRRVGEFDWALLRRAASLNGPTDIALTFADHLSIENRNARRFDQLTEPTIRMIEEIERVTAAPVSLITTRFHSRSIIDRRAW
jgi:adenylosuccinate synthase